MTGVETGASSYSILLWRSGRCGSAGIGNLTGWMGREHKVPACQRDRLASCAGTQVARWQKRCAWLLEWKIAAFRADVWGWQVCSFYRVIKQWRSKYGSILGLEYSA